MAAAAAAPVARASPLPRLLCAAPEGPGYQPDNHSEGETPAHTVFLGMVRVPRRTPLRVSVDTQPECAQLSGVARGSLVTPEDGRMEVGITCWWRAQEE